MASVQKLLMNSLRKLVKSDLKVFKWFLKNDGHISASEMENAGVLDTVDKIVARSGPEDAVKITVDILRKMKQNLLAEELENIYKEVQTNTKMKTSSAGAASEPICDKTFELKEYSRSEEAQGSPATHTTTKALSSNPKSSGLNIDPLLKCQSCVDISDPDQWVQIEPSVCTDEGVSKFRAITGPGRYECDRTRMRWVCDRDVILQYHTVDGQFLNAELERLQSNRIAPVMDVTMISGKLEEVHLPHYACLGESEESLRDAVNVLSVKDEGITLEPVQLTRFHAKIVQPSFSIKTLIVSWFKGWSGHCDLLLYMRSEVPLILHLYIFPIDPRAKEEVEKKEKSNVLIPHPRPDRPLQMETPHVLDVPGASVHPKEGITLRGETDPNFFKIKTCLEDDLQMSLIREKDKETVWSATLEKDEFDQIHPQRDEPRLNSEADKARCFDDGWSDLIQGVTNVQIIADKLLQQQLIHKEQYSEITQSLTSQNGMRKICDIVRRRGDAVKAKLISILQEENLYHF